MSIPLLKVTRNEIGDRGRGGEDSTSLCVETDQALGLNLESYRKFLPPEIRKDGVGDSIQLERLSKREVKIDLRRTGGN